MPELQPLRYLRGPRFRLPEETVSVPKSGSCDPGKGTVLDEAARLVNGDRAEAYGHPSVIYAPVGRIWAAQISARFGIAVPDLPPDLVCLMLAGMKIGRHSTRPSRDSLVDAAGYCRTVEMCESALMQVPLVKEPAVKRT